MSTPSAPLPPDPTLERDRELARRLERRRAFFFVAAVVPAFVVADLLIAPHAVAITLPLRLAWSAILIAFGWRMHSVPVPRYRLFVAVGASASAAFWLAICAASGGLQSPLFAWHLAIPLAVAVIAQDEVIAVYSGVGTAVLGAVALMLFWRVSAHDLAVWTTLLLASSSVALYASVTYRKLHLAELAIDDARIAAVGQLADSESRRLRSERLAVLGHLAAGVAHELNNPLNILTMNVEMLERYPVQVTDETKRVARLKAIREASDRIGQIARDLRSYVREPTVEASSTGVEEVVDVAMRLSAFRLKFVTHLLREVEPGLPMVAMGPRPLSQVLVNLLVNAGDALEDRGRGAQVKVRAFRDGEFVAITVEDNGPGIPPQLLPRLFHEPVTTKPGEKGTGLGLTLSREYVERAGGTISVENLPGGGARFTVRVRPIRAASA